MEGCVFNQQVDITPILPMTRRIVHSSLNFETNEIFDVNDRQAQAADKFQAFGAVEHA